MRFNIFIHISFIHKLNRIYIIFYKASFTFSAFFLIKNANI